MELITRRIIQDFEGESSAKLDLYKTPGTPEYRRLVDEIARRLELTSLEFSKIDTLIKSIGLPKECICTHCFDGTGCHPDVAYAEDHKEEK